MQRRLPRQTFSERTEILTVSWRRSHPRGVAAAETGLQTEPMALLRWSRAAALILGLPSVLPMWGCAGQTTLAGTSAPTQPQPGETLIGEYDGVYIDDVYAYDAPPAPEPKTLSSVEMGVVDVGRAGATYDAATYGEVSPSEEPIGYETLSNGDRIEVVRYVHTYTTAVETFPRVYWSGRYYYNVNGDFVFWSPEYATWCSYWGPPTPLVVYWNGYYPWTPFAWGVGYYGSGWYWGGVSPHGYHAAGLAVTHHHHHHHHAWQTTNYGRPAHANYGRPVHAGRPVVHPGRPAHRVVPGKPVNRAPTEYASLGEVAPARSPARIPSENAKVEPMRTAPPMVRTPPATPVAERTPPPPKVVHAPGTAKLPTATAIRTPPNTYVTGSGQKITTIQSSPIRDARTIGSVSNVRTSPPSVRTSPSLAAAPEAIRTSPSSPSSASSSRTIRTEVQPQLRPVAERTQPKASKVQSFNVVRQPVASPRPTAVRTEPKTTFRAPAPSSVRVTPRPSTSVRTAPPSAVRSPVRTAPPPRTSAPIRTAPRPSSSAMRSTPSRSSSPVRVAPRR